MQHELLTVDEVAALLRVTKTWVYDHLTRAEPILPHYRLGNTIRFKRDDIEAFLVASRVTKPSWDR